MSGRCPFQNDKPIRFNKIFWADPTIVQMYSKIFKIFWGVCRAGAPFKNDKLIRFNKI